MSASIYILCAMTVFFIVIMYLHSRSERAQWADIIEGMKESNAETTRRALAYIGSNPGEAAQALSYEKQSEEMVRQARESFDNAEPGVVKPSNSSPVFKDDTTDDEYEVISGQELLP